MPDPRPFAAAILISLFGMAACDSGTSPAETSNGDDIAQLTNASTALAMACGGCHSAQSDAMVSLEGYGETAMRDALLRYRSETEGTTVMHRLARGYTDQDIDLLARHFSQEEDGE
nr:hypothetical protein [Hyphomonas sp. Mor2]